MIRKFLTIASMLIFIATLAGCAPAEKKEEKKPEATEKGFKTLKEGVLTVGSDVAFPPFEFKDEKTQEIIGFDVDLAKEVGKRLDLQVEFVPANFDSIIPALKANKFDCVISAMTITEEREKQVDFSDPYIESDQSLAVKSGSPIKSTKDLRGKIVGVQRGTTGELKAQELQKQFGIKEVRAYDDTLLAFEDLKAGRIAAVVNDLPVTAYLVKKQPQIQIVETIKTGEKYGVAFREDQDELREAYNKALAEIKADGTYDQIYEKWFGKK